MRYKDSNAPGISRGQAISAEDQQNLDSHHRLSAHPKQRTYGSSTSGNGTNSRARDHRFSKSYSASSKKPKKPALSGKSLIASFFLLSLIFHFVLIQGIHFLSDKEINDRKPQKTKKATFKIKLPEEPQKKEDTAPSKPIKAQAEKSGSAKPLRQKVPQVRVASPQQLISLGQSHMAMVREGTFPPLTLSYNDPATFVSEMYRLGAKTVLFDKQSGRFYEIDLLGTDIFPLSRNDFEGFSVLKRVVKDPQWNHQKIRAASRLKTSTESLTILLLLPLSVETRWIGHQVSLFKQLKLDISDIQTVDAQFKSSRLRLERIYLKDGTSMEVRDYGCG